MGRQRNKGTLKTILIAVLIVLLLAASATVISSMREGGTFEWPWQRNNTQPEPYAVVATNPAEQIITPFGWSWCINSIDSSITDVPIVTRVTTRDAGKSEFGVYFDNIEICYTINGGTVIVNGQQHGEFWLSIPQSVSMWLSPCCLPDGFFELQWQFGNNNGLVSELSEPVKMYINDYGYLVFYQPITDKTNNTGNTSGGFFGNLNTDWGLFGGVFGILALALVMGTFINMSNNKN